MGHTLLAAQWCAIGAGTSWGIVSLCGTLLALQKKGVCGSDYGHHVSKRFRGHLWI